MEKIKETIDDQLDLIQSVLDFQPFSHYHQFASNQSIGRAGTLGFIVGVITGAHFIIVILLAILKILTNVHGFIIFPFYSKLIDIMVRIALHISAIKIIFMVFTQIIWSSYIACLGLFHFLEFFATAVNQPRNVSTDCKSTLQSNSP